MLERKDDFHTRRTHLADLSEAELEQRFWALADQLTEPLIDLARSHTTPAIERSVLLRMGFSSLEAKAIVDRCIDNGLMGKGAGHVVYRLATEGNMDIRTAGLALAEGRYWKEITESFGRGAPDAADSGTGPGGAE